MTETSWEFELRMREWHKRDIQARLSAPHMEAGWMDDAGVPRKYRAADLDQLRTPKPGDVVRAYCEFLRDRVRTGKGLVLTGDPGLQKSMSCGCIMRAAFRVYCTRTRFWPHWISAGDLAAALTSRRWARSGETLRETYSRAPLLVIDDLDRIWAITRGQSAAIGEVDLFFEVRNAEELATVVTSNLTVARLAEKGLARAVDRWQENAEIVEIEGESLRGQAQTTFEE